MNITEIKYREAVARARREQGRTEVKGWLTFLAIMAVCFVLALAAAN